MIGLSVIASTSARGEITREQALAYKACEEAMEALMGMNKSTFLAQLDRQETERTPGTFTVKPLKETDGSSPEGAYALYDLSTVYDSSSPPRSLVEIRVRFCWKNIRIQLSNRRHLP
jgi:hypothetical protein